MNYYQNLIKKQFIITNCIATSESFYDFGYSKDKNGLFSVDNIKVNKYLLKDINTEYFERLDIKNLIELLIILNEYYLALKMNFSAVLTLEVNTIFIEKKDNILKDNRNNGICRIFVVNDKENKIYNFNIDEKLQDKISMLINDLKKIKKNVNEEFQPYKKILIKNKSIVFLEGSGGYFIHEILGHLVESDYINNNYSFIGNNYKIGDYLGNENLNVCDDPLQCKNIMDLGSIDDEGEKMNNIEIIKKGKLSGILCNKKDSEKYGDKFKGCARRQSYQNKSIPRMRNTFIIPNSKGQNEDQIIKDSYDRIGINQVYSGFVNPITGQFQLQGEGYRIKNGVIQNKIKKLIVFGDLINSLKNIKIIGKEFFSYPVYCSKFNQTIPVCIGSPTIVVENLDATGEIYE